MQRYIINIKLQNLNLFLKLTNIKKTVVICLKIRTFVVAITTHYMQDFGYQHDIALLEENKKDATKQNPTLSEWDFRFL